MVKSSFEKVREAVFEQPNEIWQTFCQPHYRIVLQKILFGLNQGLFTTYFPKNSQLKFFKNTHEQIWWWPQKKGIWTQSCLTSQSFPARATQSSKVWNFCVIGRGERNMQRSPFQWIKCYLNSHWYVQSLIMPIQCSDCRACVVYDGYIQTLRETSWHYTNRLFHETYAYIRSDIGRLNTLCVRNYLNWLWIKISIPLRITRDQSRSNRSGTFFCKWVKPRKTFSSLVFGSQM